MSAASALVIEDGHARAVIRPDLGGGVARYELADGTPLFRPAPDGTTKPFALACILMVPWCSRISGGSFRYQGEYYTLPANVKGDALPIHGSGFQQSWRVTKAEPARIDLELECDRPFPFRYTARASYELRDGALQMLLAVVNASDRPLPYGLGFHPWLPRPPGTTLQLAASAVWLSDAQALPTQLVPVTAKPDWDFSASRPLPAAGIDNVFAGCSGRARVEWPDQHLALDIEAGPGLDHCIVFSPAARGAFVCVEPVTHAPNAHNLPGGALANGLVELLTDEELAVECRFVPRRL